MLLTNEDTNVSRMNKADIEKVGSGLVVNCPVTGTDATKGSLQHAGKKNTV